MAVTLRVSSYRAQISPLLERIREPRRDDLIVVSMTAPEFRERRGFHRAPGCVQRRDAQTPSNIIKLLKKAVF